MLVADLLISIFKTFCLKDATYIKDKDAEFGRARRFERFCANYSLASPKFVIL